VENSWRQIRIQEKRKEVIKIKEQIIAELSHFFHERLVKDLIESYEKVLIEYKRAKWGDTLLFAGRFVENVFRILHYIRTGEVVKEIESIQDEIKLLQNESKDKLDESIRIIIPRIASSIPYTLRSKRDVAHVKFVDPSYIDATLSVTACDWILAELIRLYHTSNENKILEMINVLIRKKMPFIERHGEEIFITKRFGWKGEILLLLSEAPDGLERSEIGKVLERYYAPSTITEALQKLVEERFVVYSETTKRYYITGPGEIELENIISKFTWGENKNIQQKKKSKKMMKRKDIRQEIDKMSSG